MLNLAMISKFIFTVGLLLTNLAFATDNALVKTHLSTVAIALDKGLFVDTFKSEKFKISGHPSKDDFIELAKRIGIVPSRIDKLLAPFLEKRPLVESLISRSFLSTANKRGYLLMYNTKRNYLIV